MSLTCPAKTSDRSRLASSRTIAAPVPYRTGQHQLIALCTQNFDCSFDMTERRYKFPALSEIEAIIVSAKSFGRRVSRALGADQRALEESLVILMPAL